MKLLIITQRVDSEEQLLGFFLSWLKEFSRHFDKVNILCLEKGKFDLPSNVEVRSLGKDRGSSKITQLFNFYKEIISLRSEYDVVFVHMNPRYVVYGGWLWKLMGKKISLWYAHGHVNSMLRVAEKISDTIFTSTPEGFRIQSDKVKVVGQGIDTELFKPDPRKHNGTFKIVSVGRLSPSKDYETLIKAVEILKNENFEVEIAGSAALDKDKEYASRLEGLIKTKDLNGKIKFIGSIPNKQLAEYLKSVSLFVNMSHTGSLDKAVLEAMSSGLIVLTCNEALESVLGKYAPMLMYPKKDQDALAVRIRSILEMPEEQRKIISADLRNIVVNGHNLQGLINKIADNLKHAPSS